jgi:RimJ/RimL family protein N-acetyltransferase
MRAAEEAVRQLETEHEVQKETVEATAPLLYDVPTLDAGDGVCLVPATGDHAAVLARLMKDPEVMLQTGSVHSSERARRIAAGDEELEYSAERLEEIYERWSVAVDRAVWVIEADGDVVGEILLLDLDADNLACGLRLWIAGRTGSGIGTRAIRAALSHAFDTVGLHRVSLEVYDHNPRARRLYERIGFVHEGTLRAALRLDEDWVDAHVMAMLRPEWERRPR